MALHILINATPGLEPTLYHALHAETNKERLHLNELIRKFQKDNGFPVKRIVVTGDSIVVVPPGQEEVP